MAFVKTSRSDQEDHKGLEIIADAFSLPDGTVVSSATKGAAIVALVALTDSSGGASGGNTVPVVPAAIASVGTDTSAATVVSVNASITAIKNDIATLSAKVNALIAALKA